MTRERRLGRRVALCAAVAAACVACGDDDAAPSTSADAAPVVTSAPATTAGDTATTAAPTTELASTRSASDATGSTAPPPDDPGRVVVLAEEPLLADVLVLGIDPVASSAAVPEVGFQGLEDADTEGITVLPMTTLDLEQVAELEPDTIITLQFWADQIGADRLEEMGELIAVPDGLSVPDRVRYLGDQLGRTEEAEAIVEELDAATEDAAAAVPDDCRVSLVAIYSGPAPAVFVAGPWDLPTAVMDAGCALDPDASDAAPDQNGRVYLSEEQIGMLDAPTLVLLQSTSVQGEQDAIAAIQANPLWAQLPAVQSGDVVTFDRIGYPGARGQIRFLAELADALG